MVILRYCRGCLVGGSAFHSVCSDRGNVVVVSGAGDHRLIGVAGSGYKRRVDSRVGTICHRGTVDVVACKLCSGITPRQSHTMRSRRRSRSGKRDGEGGILSGAFNC